MNWFAGVLILVGLGLLIALVLGLNAVARSVRRAAETARRPDPKLLDRLSAEAAWVEGYSKLPKEEQSLRRDEFVASLARTGELLKADILPAVTDGQAGRPIPGLFGTRRVSETERIRQEMMALRGTAASASEVARLDQRMKESFDREAQELRAKIEQLERVPVRRAPYQLPKPLRVPVATLLSVVLAGVMLELTIGRGFIFRGANEYRAAAPWIFGASLTIFALLFFALSRVSSTYQDQFPTRWVRNVIVFPVTAAMCAAAVLIAPLGWAALLGSALGTSTDALEAKIVDIGPASTSSKGCRQSAEIEAQGATAKICVEGRTSEKTLDTGDKVLLSGRSSFVGFYVDNIRAR